MSKSSAGNFFEDFRLGQVIDHATPRTVTAGDTALNLALYGTRFAVPAEWRGQDAVLDVSGEVQDVAVRARRLGAFDGHVPGAVEARRAEAARLRRSAAPRRRSVALCSCVW